VPGKRDAVFVNNWIEGAIIGFFFEISRGATASAGIPPRARTWTNARATSS
jgi:hypothetical protein